MQYSSNADHVVMVAIVRDSPSITSVIRKFPNSVGPDVSEAGEFFLKVWQDEIITGMRWQWSC